MKNYKRLTRWSDLGTLHIFDFVGKEIPLCDISPIDRDNLAGRLAKLEDKIESGELIDRDEYIDRLMAAKDISGMTDKELEFFAKHNARVRENAEAEIARLTAEVAELRARLEKAIEPPCVECIKTREWLNREIIGDIMFEWCALYKKGGYIVAEPCLSKEAAEARVKELQGGER